MTSDDSRFFQEILGIHDKISIFFDLKCVGDTFETWIYKTQLNILQTAERVFFNIKTQKKLINFVKTTQPIKMKLLFSFIEIKGCIKWDLFNNLTYQHREQTNLTKIKINYNCGSALKSFKPFSLVLDTINS